MNTLTRPTLSALKASGTRGYAKATLVGRLGAAPTELKAANGKVFFSYPLGVSKPPKRDANGELVKDEHGYPVRDTNWFTIYNFEQNAAEYLPSLQPGTQMLVETTLDQKSTPNEEGVNIKSIVLRELSHRVVSRPKKD
ncbi:hypothetical protein Q5752_002361 [Cryptotrichosporon argae]